MGLGAQRTDMAADHAPLAVRFTRPHPRVAVHTTHERAAHFDAEPCPEADEGALRAHTPHAQFLGLVRTKPYGAGRVSVEILRLGRVRAVGSGEQQIVGEESAQGLHIGVELRAAQTPFQVDDFRVWRTDVRGAHVVGTSRHDREQGSEALGG